MTIYCVIATQLEILLAFKYKNAEFEKCSFSFRTLCRGNR